MRYCPLSRPKRVAVPTRTSKVCAMRSSGVLLFSLPACVALASAGCNGAEKSPSGGKADVTADAREPGNDGARPPPDVSGRDAAPPAPECRGPGYAGSPANQHFFHLSATVVDENGKPIPDLIAQACGTNVCLNGTTAADGSVVIDQSVSMTKPAFKYSSGTSYAKFALPLTDATVKVDLGTQKTFTFDAPGAGAPLAPGVPATSRGVTLTPSSETAKIDPDPFDFDTPDLKKFRAVEVPVDAAPAAVDPALKFEMVVALTPAATVMCPSAALQVPNTPGWPAGTRVEFLLHGVDVAEEWAPYGGWAKVSGGAVSEDGKSVETDPNEGIPALSVVGIRRAPSH
jgi:hypothetical protein